MTNGPDDGGKPTPKEELRRRIMDPNVPKNEREWWAYHEIGHMRELLTKAARLIDRASQPDWPEDKRERQMASMLSDDIKSALGVKKEETGQ